MKVTQIPLTNPSVNAYVFFEVIPVCTVPKLLEYYGYLVIFLWISSSMLKDIIMLWDINDLKGFLHIHNICFEELQGFFFVYLFLS